MKLEFFMDVSPQWWIKARLDKEYLNQYIFEKFEHDYYPRVIQYNRNKIDLDQDGGNIKKNILALVKMGKFEIKFLPEDENFKEGYSISNGIVQFQPKRIKINARLLITLVI